MEATQTPHPTKKFLPRWRGPVEGYAVNTIHKYLPKLSHFLEFEDLYQEAYLVYISCRNRYGSVVDNAPWFMALYKRCLCSRLWDIEKAAKKGQQFEWVDVETYDASTGEEGLLSVALRQLPQELVDVVKTLIDAPSEICSIGTRTTQQLRRKLEEHLA